MPITAEQLLQAYAHGIFPMAPQRDSSTIAWYDPPQRGILPLEKVHLSRSLVKLLRRNEHYVTINQAFQDVVAGCAAREDTWISPTIAMLYQDLHTRGHAHSVEVWQDSSLIGGTYGVALGAAFFGESMFSRRPNASKLALAHLLARLKRRGFTLCDTQYLTPHLATFGGIEIPRALYKRRLAAAINQQAQFASVSSGIGSAAAAGEADTTGVAVAALLGDPASGG